MGWVAARVVAVFMARVAVQMPTFKILKVIKVAIVSNLSREVSSSSLDIRAIQSS